jgi:hypothetical protein
MCEVKSKEKTTKNKPPKTKYIGQQGKKMNCDEPHLTSNEKTRPIQWIKRPADALVVAGSF